MKNSMLVDYLKKCDEAYFKESKSIVDDATYDALVETLRRLDPNNEYLKGLGTVEVKSNKVGRIVPMGTLSKYHTEEEVTKWIQNTLDEGEYILVTPKYDGFAVELIYSDHKLVGAGTRGDFYVGEDVLPAMQYIESVPKTLPTYLPGDLIVRGEAIINKHNHNAVKALGYSAMRNAVPGIVRSCRTEALNYVDYVAYEFIDGDTDRLDQRFRYLDQFFVETFSTVHSNDFESMQKSRDFYRSDSFDYETDGVVLKTVDIGDEDYVSPKRMIAWKYKSKYRVTTLRDVEFQMGVTGYFTPVGIFDEVEFQGAKLTRASLGNLTRMINEFEGVTLGSLVNVSRRGDIIPYIEGIIEIDNTGVKVEIPKVCPHCGKPLSLEGEPHCINKACPEKLRLQILQYVRYVGIKGIGDKLVTALIEREHLQSIQDIYEMDPEVIFNIPRQGQSAVNKWKNLQEKKMTDLELLSAYPFLDLGQKIWEVVLSKFSFNQILNITEDDLREAELRGIGDSKIASIVSQVSDNADEIKRLRSIVL